MAVRALRLASLAVLAAAAPACSILTGYPAATESARAAFARGDFAVAAAAYRSGASGGDELLYRLEEALTLQTAGDFEASRVAFEKAETVVEGFDARPTIAGRDVVEGIGVAFLNDKALPYEGDHFERVLLNTLNALNYWMQGDRPGALVEVRRAAIRIGDAEREGPPAKDSPPPFVFARYLAGTLRELSGDLDGAYVDYQQVAQVQNNFPRIQGDLLRIALASGRLDDAERWRREQESAAPAPSISTDPAPTRSELVVVFGSGWAPVKDSTNVVLPTGHSVTKISIPKYHAQPDPAGSLRILVDGQEVARTAPIEDVAAVAMHRLDEKLPSLIAKTLARATGRAVATEVAFHNVQDGSESTAWLIALFAGIFSTAVEQADLRSWLTLPREFHIARGVVEAGSREVRLELLSSGGTLLASHSLGRLELRGGRAVPLYVRSIGTSLFAHAAAGTGSTPESGPSHELVP